MRNVRARACVAMELYYNDGVLKQYIRLCAEDERVAIYRGERREAEQNKNVPKKVYISTHVEKGGVLLLKEVVDTAKTVPFHHRKSEQVRTMRSVRARVCVSTEFLQNC